MALRFYPENDPHESGIREKARAFADAKLRPIAREDDEACRFRRETFNEMAREGLTSLVIPKIYGGKELSHIAYFSALEELARGSAAMAVTAGVTNLIQGALVRFGDEKQKYTYLKHLVSGEYLGAFSLSEPGSGSDAAAMRTMAKKVDGGYRITGTKAWCSTAGHADLYLLMARTGEDKAKGISAFIISKDMPGFHIGKQEKKMGFRASSLAQLIFEDCFVPEDRRLGKEGEGFPIALSQLDAGRVSIGSVGIGLAIEAMELVGKHFRQGKVPIPEWLRSGLADHYTEVTAAKQMIRAAALERDAKRPITILAAQAKLLGSDLAMRVTGDAVVWLGEAGMIKANDVERLFRDAKALQIVEGTNQIQRLVIGREMEKMFA